MNFLKAIKKTLYSACVYFTIAEFVILAIATGYNDLAPKDGGTAGMFLSLGSSALIFLACFIIAAFNFVWNLKYSTSIKLIIHFFGTLAAWSVFFIIVPKAYDAAQLTARIFVFVALYLIVALVVLIVNSLRKARKSEKLEYKDQFEDKKKK